METEPSFAPLERLLAHEPFVRGLARSLVSDEALAQDAVQDTWLAALQGSPGTVRSPRAWLARVVRNFAFRASRSAGRRSRREREAARPEALPSTEEIVGREEARFGLDLREATKVRVRVLDAAGAAIGAAEVLLRDDRGYATPAARGAAVWEATVVPGSYVLEASAEEHGRKVLPVRVGEEPLELDVRLAGD